MARSTFYYNNKGKPDKWAVERQHLVEVFYKNKERYGYRRLTKVLRGDGYIISEKTVRRLMKESGIKCEVRMKKYKSFKGEVGKIAPNLLERDFKADYPHQKLVTDVTEFHLFGEKIYLSPVLDLYNSEIIFYTIYKRPVLDMVKDMIAGTVEVIGSNTNAILHSDQGWQYQHKDYQKMLKDNNIRQSMSRRGNCLDNAVMENFFGLLKSELLYLQKFTSVDHFLLELKEYLRYYNEERIKEKLNGKSPVQYRTQNQISYC
jgi:putative transposase